MTAKSIFNASLPVVVGGGMLALIVYYFGNQPVIKDVAKGMRGEVKA